MMVLTGRKEKEREKGGEIHAGREGKMHKGQVEKETESKN